MRSTGATWPTHNIWARPPHSFDVKVVEDQGIDPCASCMLSTRSTIWARPPLHDQIELDLCHTHGQGASFDVYYLLNVFVV